jgi:Holliday junction resolvase RusA-like endonuclease
MGTGMRMVDPSAGDKADFLTIADKNKPEVPLDTPLHVVCTFVFPRPKGHYRTGKNAHLLKDFAPYFHTGTPDVDNLTKFIGDALNGVFWKDDSCICKLIGTKVYTNGHRPRIMITICDATPLDLSWLKLVNKKTEKNKI